jgi:hypothetical protein
LRYSSTVLALGFIFVIDYLVCLICLKSFLLTHQITHLP